MFGLCFLTAAIFMKSLTDLIPSSSFKGVCLSYIVPVLQIFVGVKRFELQLNKTRAENWRMAANPSGQGRFWSEYSWEKTMQNISEVTITVTLFYGKMKKGKRGGAESSRMAAILLGQGTHTFNGWKRPLTARKLWITEHNIVPRVRKYLPRLWYSDHFVKLILDTYWALNMTCSYCTQHQSQKSNTFHVVLGTARLRQ